MFAIAADFFIRCIDKVEATEKQQKEEERLLETARTAVLDCPMCGKHFKSENVGKAYVICKRVRYTFPKFCT